MSISVTTVMIWLHLLAMVGAFGGLLFAHMTQREGGAAALKKAVRLFNIFLVIGLIAGLHLYGQKIMAAKAAAVSLGPVHMVVGIKLVLLLAAGALVGISAKAVREGQMGKGSSLRVAALLLMAIAAFLGTALSNI